MKKLSGQIELQKSMKNLQRINGRIELHGRNKIRNQRDRGENNKGWSKELNLISWNDREPKYDIRDWSPEHEKMGKGVTLSVEELKKLRDLLNEMKL